MVEILFFGRLSDMSVPIKLDIPPGVVTGEDLRALLERQNPQLGTALRARGIRMAVDQALAPLSANILTAKEIAFMSPLSGG